MIVVGIAVVGCAVGIGVLGEGVVGGRVGGVGGLVVGGAVGTCVSVGTSVGISVSVGTSVVGAPLGKLVGLFVGVVVGAIVVGVEVGIGVGARVGANDGVDVGLAVTICSRRSPKSVNYECASSDQSVNDRFSFSIFRVSQKLSRARHHDITYHRWFFSWDLRWCHCRCWRCSCWFDSRCVCVALIGRHRRRWHLCWLRCWRLCQHCCGENFKREPLKVSSCDVTLDLRCQR